MTASEIRSTRRAFLGGSAAVFAGAAGLELEDEARPASIPAPPPPTSADPVLAEITDDQETWREQFVLSDDAHFAAWVLAAHPRGVREAIARHRDGLDADAEGYVVAHQFELEVAVRSAAGRYLVAADEEIALTDSTTMGLGVVYGGMRLRADDEVITTAHDFYSTHEALRLRAAQSGATITTVELYDDPAAAAAGSMVERLVESISDRTRALAVTWTHSSTGVKLPVAEICAAVAERNASRDDAERIIVCVDAVHAFGLEVETPGELGCDVFVSGTHKWLFGPRGTGLVWANGSARRRIAPVIPPFDGSSFVGWLEDTLPGLAVSARALSPGGYHSFEHRWALTEAFELHEAIGKHRVADHTHAQAAQLKEGVAEIANLRLVTPADPDVSSGIVCVERRDGDTLELLPLLARRGFTASITPYRQQYLRFGPSIVTSDAEVDALIEALADLA